MKFVIIDFFIYKSPGSLIFLSTIIGFIIMGRECVIQCAVGYERAAGALRGCPPLEGVAENAAGGWRQGESSLSYIKNLKNIID